MIDSTTLTAFGHAIRDEWPLEAGAVYLNHGTVGVVPRRILDQQEKIRREIEAHPSRFLLRELTPLLSGPEPGRLRSAAAEVAAFLGARGEDLVFIDNATTAVNAILQSARIGSGEAILVTETTYFGVRQAVSWAARQWGAEIRVATLPLPLEDAADAVAAVEAALTPDVRLAVLDHVVSDTGIVLPVAELSARCREHGVRVLIDGAHAPGQLPLDIPSTGAHWYVGNLHKWAFAPRSCGFLWADPQVQQDTHPLVASWGYDRGFTAEFDWPGTRDPSAFLTAPIALRFLESLGLDRVRGYNHDLLWQGVELLRRHGCGRTAAPETLSGSMIAIELPALLKATETSATALRDWLLECHAIEIPISAWDGRLWARLAVQVYNELADFELLASAIDEAAAIRGTVAD